MERRFRKADTALTVERRGDGGPGVLTGYAAVYYRKGSEGTEYELWDGAVERIVRGAFDRAVDEDDVRALFNHDPNQLLGRTSADTLRLGTDSRGLRFEVMLPDTDRGRDLAAHVERGDVTGSSFAFDVTDEAWEKQDGRHVREIRGVRLYDVGPVTYPAYEATTAEIKAAGGERSARHSFRRWQARTAAERIRALEIACDRMTATLTSLGPRARIR